MSLSQFPQPLRQLRSILSELRKGLQLSGGQGVRRQNLGETQGVRHLLSQYRSNAVTQEQVCRHRQEMEFLADTYNTYLRCALNPNSLIKYFSLSGLRECITYCSRSITPRGRGASPRRPRWLDSISLTRKRSKGEQSQSLIVDSCALRVAVHIIFIPESLKHK